MASGIDTEAIVTQIMAIERRPQELLKSRVVAKQRAQTAWQAIADKLVAIKAATDALGGLNSVSKMRLATSSNPSLIGVRATGAGSSHSSVVEVVAMAAAKSVLAADAFTAATDAVGARTLEIISAGGASSTITSTDGTIGGLAQAVNAAGLGVSAKIVQTSPGQFQLSLVAIRSGTAGAFTATGTGWVSLDTVRADANAQVRVDGVLVTRSENVINDVLDGVELTLLGTSASPVIVTSTRDDAAITAKVKALVDSANALISGIGIATKASTDSTQRGPLAADVSARRMADALRSAIVQPLTTASGTTTTANALGISLTREGAITFDAAKLGISLQEDPNTVIAAIGADAYSTAAGVTVVAALSDAASTTRALSVTQAATQASLAGTSGPAPSSGTTVSLSISTTGGTQAVSFITGDTWAQTADNLNTALRAIGTKLTAVAQPGGSLNIVADRFGSGQTFSVTGGSSVGLDGTSVDGSDAVGTIDSVPFTAAGQGYSVGGLVLNLATSAAQIASAGGSVNGTIRFTAGLAGALAAIGKQGTASGSAVTAKSNLQSSIDELQQRIARYDDVLKRRESLIRNRFTAMETAIQRLQAMTTSIGALNPETS
ncbi:MAG: flagellar filament capping protein FliD [Actinobacteria bacterium]|nr:flagellar filament capping protein FliD [Actinomycetota bacterium]